MLQQTTVVAVTPYFNRFLKRFKNVETLANARLDDVLRMWEGLGYYSRARNIHAAAKIIVRQHGGRFPDDVNALAALPGIGRYTAGAIASFAFDRRAPIVEANTLRLYCRLLGYRGDPRSGSGQRLLWEFAERILPNIQPGRFNQALMELGSEICTPVDPRCDRCPLRGCCRAFTDGLQAEIPRPAKRPTITRVTEASVAINKGGAFLLRRRSPGERWEGLWDFPRFAVANLNSAPRKNGATADANNSNALPQFLEAAVLDATGIRASIRRLVAEQNHSVTRYRIRLLCFVAGFESGRLARGTDLAWVTPGRFADYPLSVTGRKFADLLAENAGI
jgi:A/G-specific adenine glycosylase